MPNKNKPENPPAVSERRLHDATVALRELLKRIGIPSRFAPLSAPTLVIEQPLQELVLLGIQKYAENIPAQCTVTSYPTFVGGVEFFNRRIVLSNL